MSRMLFPVALIATLAVGCASTGGRAGSSLPTVQAGAKAATVAMTPDIVFEGRFAVLETDYMEPFAQRLGENCAAMPMSGMTLCAYVLMSLEIGEP